MTKDKSKRGLTAKELAFVEGILAGKTKTQAWKDAYKPTKNTPQGIRSNANQVWNRPKIQQYFISRLQKQQDKTDITKEKILGKLDLIVEQFIDNRPTDAVMAIRELNKMLGYYAPIKQETTNVTLRDVLRELNEDETDKPIQDC